MKKIKQKILLYTVIIAFTLPLFSQEKASESFAIEISLENTNLKRLPIYRNSISSLDISGDYIVGGTTAKEGLTPFIFVASIDERKLLNFIDIEKVVKGQRSVHSGFAKGKNGELFAGTIGNELEGATQGGHLIKVEVDKKGLIEIEDLGVPIPGEGIFSLIGNTLGKKLFGISYPSGFFFMYDIETKKTQIYKDIAPTEEDIATYKQYILKPEDFLCRALIEDNEGMIYGSMPINKIFYFNPNDESFHILDEELPAVWKRNILGRIDAWAKDEDGILYGGNSGDGQLFSLNPSTNKVKNLGKPITQNRLRGMAIGRDSKVYGVAGGPSGYSHFFNYSEEHGYNDFGTPSFTMVAPGIEQGIPWRAFNIGSVTSSDDGKYIVMGEDESLSQILVFVVP